MKISQSWLREWVDAGLDADALAHQLTMLGLEVDAVLPVTSAELNDVVVGKVTHVDAHPKADRLTVCQVDVGGDEALTIVCGASNVRAGRCYPVARVGATLPGGLMIEDRAIRGQASSGMLCSTVELGLGDSADGIMDLGDAAPVGESIREYLELTDQVIDIDLTPNRADCFSVLGIARDVGAVTGVAVREAEYSPVAAGHDDEMEIVLEPGAGCDIFAGRIIRDINPAASTPAWLAERLRRCGIRPIHPVVDVTNYVMLELGQPMHAYDLAALKGPVRARRAVANEKLTLLGGEEITLNPDLLVIADHDGAVALAGIMGGEATAVGSGSETVFLESAYFDPAVMAGRARQFGLHTDASVRFERGVDPAGQARAIERATELLIEIAGGEAGPVTLVRTSEHPEARPTIELRREKITALLGVEIADADVEAILTRLNMSVIAGTGGWQVTPPTARFDISIEADLIEEIARIHGYDSIPESPAPIPALLGRVPEGELRLEQLRNILVDRGYQEAITYSFIDERLSRQFGGSEHPIALSNPISSELGVMRESLLPGLVQACGHNLARQHNRIRLFEIGVRFIPQDIDIIEENVVSGLACGGAEPEQWDAPSRDVDLFDIKADLHALFAATGMAADFQFRTAEHPALRPGRTAQVWRRDTLAGWVGELHPAVASAMDLPLAPVVFELACPVLLGSRVPVFGGISRFPSVRRDIAVVIDRSVAAGDLDRSVRDAVGEILQETIIFDVYEGKNVDTGSKSVALGLILKDTSRTLTDADIEGVVQAVVQRVKHDFNATIRE